MWAAMFILQKNASRRLFRSVNQSIRNRQIEKRRLTLIINNLHSFVAVIRSLGCRSLKRGTRTISNDSQTSEIFATVLLMMNVRRKVSYLTLNSTLNLPTWDTKMRKKYLSDADIIGVGPWLARLLLEIQTPVIIALLLAIITRNTN